MKSVKLVFIFLSSVLISCQINSNNFLSNNNNDFKFKIKSIPEASPSSTLQPLEFQPNNAAILSNQIIDSTSTNNVRKKEKLNFENFNPDDFKIVSGSIVVIYHNNDKFRVRSTDSISSVNKNYANQINKILNKYNVKSIHTQGYYDPADSTKIICKGKNVKEHDEDKNENENKQFKVKSLNENENREHDQDDKCDTINYTDSTLTTQKIQEEQNLLGNYYEGEFPDKLSIHIYEFSKNADTRKIAKEIKSLPFVRIAYPEIEASFTGACNISTEHLGGSDKYTKEPTPVSFGTSPNNDQIPLSDYGFFNSIPNGGFDASREEIDFPWFNQNKIFRGWEVYGVKGWERYGINAPVMPKIAIIDSGFDDTPLAKDKPNYIDGFSVDKNSFLFFDFYSIKDGDINEEPDTDFLQIYGGHSHGTANASIIGSPVNNNEGLAGVSPNSKIVPVKIKKLNESIIVKAIDKMLDPKYNDVDVINISIVANTIKMMGKDIIKTDYPINVIPSVQLSLGRVLARGKVVVVAAGNSNIELNDTNSINMQGVITVGATTNLNSNSIRDKGTYIADFSNYGKNVDIGAFGQFITAPAYIPAGKNTIESHDYAADFKGTSISAPIVSSVAGLVKKIAERESGIILSPYQIKQILTYSSSLYYDSTYPNRYIGADLQDQNHNKSLIANIRNLNLYNALIIAKNIGKYSVILRNYNTDDYSNPTFDNNWGIMGNGESLGWASYKSDEIFGINNPNLSRVSIDFRTLNTEVGYTYGYQLYYGAKYGYINDFQGAGINFFDKFDGVAGIIGAESNRFPGYGYLGYESKIINENGSPCTSLGFTTKAQSIYGTSINGVTANVNNSLGKNATNLSAFSGKTLFLGFTQVPKNPRVFINGIQQNVVGINQNSLSFVLSNNIPNGIKDIIVKSDNGDATLNGAINVDSNKQSPELTTNTNTRVYLKMNEGNGITANDSTSNHNNATIFGNYNWLISGEGIKLDGLTSYVAVPSTPSLDISKDITIEMVFTPNENYVAGDDLSLANKYSSIYPYDNSSWALNYGTYTGNSARLNAFNLLLYSGSYKLLFLLGYDKPVTPNKKYYIQASWNSVTKELNFVINGVELPVSYLGGVPNTLEPNQLNSFNLVTNPIILGGYTTINPNQPVSFTKISIDEFALHAEYRTSQQGIETSQRFGIIN